ncbi:MAG TPA: isoprenylcysteine carboxylmethyltransferase family protein [Bauldia sp.]|nr:isoprenylcysteine carboxylmethyltransferase family protein [Bauldia sp.]
MGIAEPADNIPSVLRPQRGRKAALLFFAVVAITVSLVIAPAWRADDKIHIAVEWTGLLLILVCIAGRTWCSFYIGKHKIDSLITTGPYSVTRNPLYVFSVLGGLGFGAVFGSIVFALFSGAIVLAVFTAIARREEQLLELVHGEAYREYCARVPRFWPRLSGWRDEEQLTISTSAVYVTYFDSLLFLGALPFAEAVKWLHGTGWLPVLAVLP